MIALYTTSIRHISNMAAIVVISEVLKILNIVIFIELFTSFPSVAFG